MRVDPVRRPGAPEPQGWLRGACLGGGRERVQEAWIRGLDTLSEAVMITDGQARIQYLNPAFCREGPVRVGHRQGA
jgi:PAS domain-containing protein